MTEATQTATTDAREASKSRVQTLESILPKPAAEAAKEPEGEKSPEQGKEDGESKPKQTASERIRELAAKRREAEAKAEVAQREAEELRQRLQALSANAQPLEAKAKPLRSQYATDDEYIEALSDWKAKEAIAERERQQQQARAEAEQAEIAETWSRRQEAAMQRLTDYAEVIGKSEVNVPPHIHQAILESEQGPEIAYFLASFPDEAKRIAQMKPLAAIKRIAQLERELSELAKEEAKEPPSKLPQKSKAPEPITPPKSVPSTSSSSGESFEEYKRRRLAGKQS